MKVRAHQNKKALNLSRVNKIFFNLSVFIVTILFSVRVIGQATCIGIIDSTKSEFCISGNSIAFSNAVASGEHIQWLTSGDGTFSDPFAQRPTYTMGPGDSANGYVFIYLDVYKDDTVNFCSALPVVTLHLSSMGTIATPASQTTCTNVGITNIFFSSGISGTTYTWTRNNTNVGGTITASGTANNIKPIKGTLVNNTSVPVPVTFTVTPQAASCPGTPITTIVLVNPKVTAVSTPASQTICSGSNITPIAFSGQAANTVYNWTRNKADSVTGIAASGAGNVTGALTNTNTVPVTVTFTITPVANGCTGAVTTASVIVNPGTTLISSNPSVQTICSGTAISTITSTGGPGGTVYNWTRTNTAQVPGIPASGSGNISGTLTNNTAAPLYVTFTVTPSTGSCANRTAVLVNPRPFAVATPLNQTICSGSLLTPIVLTSTTIGATFSWTRNNTASVTGVGASGSGNITGSLVNTSNSPVTVTFTITPTANGCSGNPITATVIVNPRPASVISGNYAICAGMPSPNISIALTGAGPWSFTYSEGTTPVTVTGIGSNTYEFPAPSTPCIYTVTSLSDSRCAAIAPDMTGSATITQVTYPIVASSGLNGTISPADTSQVSCGNSMAYTITPDAGFSIQDVLVDGISQGAISTYTFTNVASAHTISAVFSSIITGNIITSSASANGTITPAGEISVASGTNQTFAIAADNCYQVADVLVDGVSVGAVTTYTFTNVTTPHTINATFTQLSYLVTASAGANGSISPAGATSVSCGGSQIYTIAANSCYQIADVLVDGVSVGAVSTYTFSNISATHTISATFSPITYVITASTGANGIVTPNAATTVNCGSSQAYTITANAGYVVQDVLIDGVSVGAVSTYSFTNVTAAHAISATFIVAANCSAPTLSNTATNVLCRNASTGAIAVTTTGGTAPFTYAWTGPNGFTASTKDITGLAAGTYNLIVTATGGCTSTRSVTITEPVTALTATATAGVIACGATTTTLTVTAAGGTGTRQYSLNGGAYQNNASFTVNAAGSPYTVTVRDANLCTALTNTVTVIGGSSSVPAQPTSVTGQVYGLCGGGTFTYTVQPVAGATSYTWAVPAGCTIVSGQNTGQIQMSVPSTFTTSGTVGVLARNACGNGTQYRFTVFAVLYYAPAAIIGPSTVTAGQANVQYSLPFTPGATFNWLVPSGAVITGGQGTNVLTVTFGSSSGNVSVTIVNACGTAPRSNKAVTIVAGRPGVTTKEISSTSTQPYLSVYPNPVANNTTVIFGAPAAGTKFEVVISNALGETLVSKSGMSIAGKNMLQFDMGKHAGGVYFVKLLTGKQILTKKLVKEK